MISSPLITLCIKNIWNIAHHNAWPELKVGCTYKWCTNNNTLRAQWVLLSCPVLWARICHSSLYFTVSCTTAKLTDIQTNHIKISACMWVFFKRGVNLLKIASRLFSHCREGSSPFCSSCAGNQRTAERSRSHNSSKYIQKMSNLFFFFFEKSKSLKL